MKNNTYDIFLELCDVCNDDVSVVAKLIEKYHTPNEKLSRIESDLEDWNEIERLERYHDTINLVLDKPWSEIKLFIACNTVAPLMEIEYDEEYYEDDDYEMEVKVTKRNNTDHFIESLFDKDIG